LGPKGVDFGIDLDSGLGWIVEEERFLGRPPPGPRLKGLVLVRLNGHEEVPATGSAKGQRQAFRAAPVTLANPFSEQLPARCVRTTPEPSQAAEEPVDAGPDLNGATFGQARTDEKRGL